MLVNNFKMLITFANTNTFKDVGNNNVTYKFLGGKATGTSGVLLNNHHAWGTLGYDYDLTTGSNSYTNEQTPYSYLDIVCDKLGTGTTNDLNNIQNGFILFVGTGDTPVTANDYKLDTPISLPVASASCKHNTDNTTVVMRTFVNETEDDIEIKEIGLYVFQTNRYTSSDTRTFLPVLIGRKVLENPVIIGTGSSYAFTYTINMNNITFSEADE